MDNYQRSLLDKLENVLKNIVVECYKDENFEDVVNLEIFDNNVDNIIYKIQNQL